MRDRYFAKGTDNWVKYTKQIYNYQQKVLKDEQKALETQQKDMEKALKEEQKAVLAMYDDVADYATKKLDEIVKKQERLAKNLNSYGSLYNVNTVKINGFTDQYYSLHDLSTDIEVIERYAKDMNSIRERASRLSVAEDAGNYLFSSITEMDTKDAVQFMRALLYADDNTFFDYTQKAYEKFNLSRSVSAAQFEDEFSRGIEDAYGNMKEILAKAGYEIPEGFYVSGGISAEKFGEGFVAELDNQLSVIRSKIDEFNMKIETGSPMGGNVYNTTNTSYNISAAGGGDTVEQIRRYETVKRLAGVNGEVL